MTTHRRLFTSQGEWATEVGGSVATIRELRSRHGSGPGAGESTARRKLEGFIAGEEIPKFLTQGLWQAIAELADADIGELRRKSPAPAAAKPAAITSPAAPAAPAAPRVEKRPLTTAEKYAAAQAASAVTQETAANHSDAYLRQAATHRLSPPADRAIATAELQRRGYTINPEAKITTISRKS